MTAKTPRARLKRLVAKLPKRLFGRKSERQAGDDPGQLLMADRIAEVERLNGEIAANEERQLVARQATLARKPPGMKPCGGRQIRSSRGAHGNPGENTSPAADSAGASNFAGACYVGVSRGWAGRPPGPGKLVGAAGFEPATYCSQSSRANQTALRSDKKRLAGA